jgi:phosphoribosylanthranilate isomerase
MPSTVPWRGGATHIGFIFFAKSPRNVLAGQARDLASRARGKVSIVAVTVDASDAELDEIVDVLKPDMLQLHGHETTDRVRDVKARYGLPVIKAVSIRDADDLRHAATYDGIADRLLLDAKAPAGSELPGGNGVSFDWTLLASPLDARPEYMLSGGLNESNVVQALELTGARGIDVSSGVESAPGRKDPGRITAFLKTVHAYEGSRRTKPARAGSVQ